MSDYTKRKKWWVVRSVHGFWFDESDENAGPDLYATKEAAEEYAEPGDEVVEVLLSLQEPANEVKKLRKALGSLTNTVTGLQETVARLDRRPGCACGPVA